MNKINVLIIFGGRSVEHEVSILSAKAIFKAIDKKKYNAIPILISKDGFWTDGKNFIEASKSKNSANKILVASFKNKIKPLEFIRNRQINVVFPILHGPLGEDGTIQGLLEMANIAYAGCGVLASALGMNKIKQKQIFQNYGLPIVEFFYFNKDKWNKNKNKLIEEIEKYFSKDYPLFTKPANSGSSIGVSKVKNRKNLIEGIKKAFLYDYEVIIEKEIENRREIEVGLLGGYEPEVSLPGEIFYKGDFYDYEAKYKDKNTKIKIPVRFRNGINEEIRSYARTAYKALECYGFARVDFFIDKNSKVWVNELNTIPGFTQYSMFPKVWEKSGYNFEKLVDKLIKLGIKRWEENKKIRRFFTKEQ